MTKVIDVLDCAFIIVACTLLLSPTLEGAGVQDNNEDSAVVELYNYPNPFDPEEGPTNILYTLSDDAEVELSIYDFAGGLILEEEFRAGELGGLAGENVYQWDGKNENGEQVIEGAYICAVKVLISDQGTDVFERKSTKIGVK